VYTSRIRSTWDSPRKNGVNHRAASIPHRTRANPRTRVASRTCRLPPPRAGSRRGRCLASQLHVPSASSRESTDTRGGPVKSGVSPPWASLCQSKRRQRCEKWQSLDPVNTRRVEILYAASFDEIERELLRTFVTGMGRVAHDNLSAIGQPAASASSSPERPAACTRAGFDSLPCSTRKCCLDWTGHQAPSGRAGLSTNLRMRTGDGADSTYR
jgi:hypothetical protein